MCIFHYFEEHSKITQTHDNSNLPLTRSKPLRKVRPNFWSTFPYFQIPHQETRPGIEHGHMTSESAEQGVTVA